MSNTLDNIAAACGEGNASGFKTKIYVQKMSNVESIPAATADSMNVDTDIVLKATEVWKVFEISKNEQRFEIKSEGDEDSASKIAELDFYIPKSTPGKSYILHTNSVGCPLIVIATDRNGNKRILGEVEEGFYMSVDENITGKNGYVCKGKYESVLGPLFYNGALPT